MKSGNKLFQSIFHACMKIYIRSKIHGFEDMSTKIFHRNFFDCLIDNNHEAVLLNNITFTFDQKIRALRQFVADDSTFDQSREVIYDLIDSLTATTQIPVKETDDPVMDLDSEKNPHVDAPIPSRKKKNDKVSYSVEELWNYKGVRRKNDRTGFGGKTKPIQPTRTETNAKKPKQLNKLMASSVKKELLKVNVPFPYYTKCKGCELCVHVFQIHDLTWCSKRHKGDPCNPFGLYPHVGEKILSQIHDTKQINLPTTDGFINPQKELQKAASDVEDACIETSTSNASNTKFGDISEYTAVRHDYAEITLAEKMAKVRNAQHWRLQAGQAINLFVEANKRFLQLKKHVPNYVPPSWATFASKMLFLTGNVESARSMAANRARRMKHKKFSRNERRLLRLH